jgi:hypothetical protein
LSNGNRRITSSNKINGQTWYEICNSIAWSSSKYSEFRYLSAFSKSSFTLFLQIKPQMGSLVLRQYRSAFCLQITHHPKLPEMKPFSFSMFALCTLLYLILFISGNMEQKKVGIVILATNAYFVLGVNFMRKFLPIRIYTTYNFWF